MEQTLYSLGIGDGEDISTAQLLDNRTVFFLKEYEYYSNPATPPAPYDNIPWFDSVITLSRLTPRLF